MEIHPLFTPITSIITGLVILIWPAILNYVIAFYLILIGTVALMQ